MVDVKIESNGATVKLLSGLANFELGKPFMEAAGKTVVESIHRNIKNQVEPDGSPIFSSLLIKSSMPTWLL